MANGLLEGILQGLVAGKEQKRQSLLDQLRLQHEKLQIDYQKAQIKQAEQEYKFKLADRQLKQVEAVGEQRTNVLGELGFVPEQAKEQLGQVPQETFEDRRRLLQGAQPLQDIGLQETVSAVKQVPVQKKAPKDIKSPEAFKQELEMAKEKEKIKTPTLSDQDVAIANYLKENRGKTYTQATEWYKSLGVTTEKAKPGSTVDEILNLRYKWLQDNEQEQVHIFYRKVWLNNPEIVRKLASQDTGVPEGLIPIFIQFKDFKEFRSAAIEKQRKKPKTPADFQELLSQAQVWFGYKPKPFFEFLEKIDRATGLSK